MPKRADLEDDIGRPDAVDLHPLIACAAHLLDGHAHLKDKRVLVERVLSALAKERRAGPLVIDPTKNGLAVTITNEEVKAVYRFAIDTFDNLAKLYAEMDRARQQMPGARHDIARPKRAGTA